VRTVTVKTVFAPLASLFESPPYEAVTVCHPVAEGTYVTEQLPRDRSQEASEKTPLPLDEKTTVPVGEAPSTNAVQDVD